MCSLNIALMPYKFLFLIFLVFWDSMLWGSLWTLAIPSLNNTMAGAKTPLALESHSYEGGTFLMLYIIHVCVVSFQVP